MAKLWCPCGELIRLSGSIPNPLEWLLWRSEELPYDAEIVEMASLITTTTSMFRCPRSDHLFVFWSGFADEATVYAPVPDRI
jgi:hypothetical protein